MMGNVFLGYYGVMDLKSLIAMMDPMRMIEHVVK